MTILLLKSDGSTRTFTTQELATILVSLEASNATSQTTSGITFVRIAANRLLIMDDNVLHNRKIIELMAIAYDSSNPFSLKFTSNNIDFTLDQALSSVGFAGLTPVANLANVNMVQYELFDEQYVLPG